MISIDTKTTVQFVLHSQRIFYLLLQEKTNFVILPLAYTHVSVYLSNSSITAVMFAWLRIVVDRPLPRDVPAVLNRSTPIDISIFLDFPNIT